MFWVLELNHECYSSVTHAYIGSSCRLPDIRFIFTVSFTSLKAWLLSTESDLSPHWRSYRPRCKWPVRTIAHRPGLVAPLLHDCDTSACEAALPFSRRKTVLYQVSHFMIRPNAKGIVCQLREMIREGAVSPEFARTLVPRFDLEIAVVKKQHAMAVN